jgi:hypothetical protein
MLRANLFINAILGILGVKHEPTDQSTHRSQATDYPADHFLVHDFLLNNLFAFSEATRHYTCNVCHRYLVMLCIILHETHQG